MKIKIEISEQDIKEIIQKHIKDKMGIDLNVGNLFFYGTDLHADGYEWNDVSVKAEYFHESSKDK